MSSSSLAQAKRDARRQPHQPVEVPISLHHVRKALGLSLKDLVALMPPRSDGQAWSEAAISRAEHGQRGTSPEFVDALAEGIRRAMVSNPGFTREQNQVEP